MPIAPDRILFEDQWLLAVDKLGGELVVKGKGRVDKLPLLDFLRKQYPSLAPIHRLDFETSGVVVFAKSRKVLATILEKKFAGWQKHYRALVFGTPKRAKGVIDVRLPARSHGGRDRQWHSGDGKVAAETNYIVLETIGPVSVVELSFERGQRHQIRRHMAMIHHPLILDEVYGDPKAHREFSKFLKLRRFFLHASSVTFPHPVTGRTVTVSAPMPRAFLAAVKKLKDFVKNGT